MIYYLKNYFKIHIKCWYIYVATIFSMAFALFISLLIGKYTSAWITNINTIRLICVIIFGTVSSIPILIPNYLFSKRISREVFTIKFLVTIILSEIISILFFSLIGFVLFFI